MPQTPMRKRPLPHAANRLFLAEGGMETVMIFRKGIELPAFSSIELVRTFAGRAQLEFYYETYLSIARATGLGLILDTATWRASPDWQTAIGFPDRATLAEAHRMAVRQIESLRADNERADSPILISGTIGPRGDGYSPDMTMTTKQAEDYHGWQMDVFAGTAVDLVTALTIPTVNEAVGIARAARRHAMPLALSFTARPTAACRAACRSPRRSRPPTPPPAPRRSTTW